jgi:hypothetical protein
MYHDEPHEEEAPQTTNWIPLVAMGGTALVAIIGLVIVLALNAASEEKGKRRGPVANRDERKQTEGRDEKRDEMRKEKRIEEGWPEAGRRGGATSAGSPARGGDERLDIDPVLQGEWQLHATSRDQGKTVAWVQGAFCRVTATKVRFVDGDELVAEKIIIVKDRERKPSNIIWFTNGTIWCVSKKLGQKYILVQKCEMDGKAAKETFRFLVSVRD